jgi:hypothetical protein
MCDVDHPARFGNSKNWKHRCSVRDDRISSDAFSLRIAQPVLRAIALLEGIDFWDVVWIETILRAATVTRLNAEQRRTDIPFSTVRIGYSNRFSGRPCISLEGTVTGPNDWEGTDFVRLTKSAAFEEES